VLLGAVLLVAGIALVLWGAERFTDGSLGVARAFALSPFYVGTVVSGFEPENLVTGLAANLAGLPQVALGTVIGAAVFMLTAGLGVALLLVPMEVTIPRAGPVGMLIILGVFAIALFSGGTVGRVEGGALLLVALGLMVWLYRRSPVLVPGAAAEITAAPPSRLRAVALLLLGVAAMIVGAGLVVRGVGSLIATAGFSETFIGMTIVAMGESLEETARMVVPARRGHPELAWGNVVGTLVILLGLNLGVLALVRPLAADPLVLRLHTPYLIGVSLLVAMALLLAHRLGRGTGAILVTLYILYLALNVPHMWR
jgi:cation:H+ antiporter